MSRAIYLDGVGRDAQKVWKDLPIEFRTDKEFIVKALANSPTLPHKCDFERNFPQALRFDRDVVLAFCERPDFVELFHQRHLFVPQNLTGDKEIMIQYCQKISRSLQECTEELCDDRDVVEAAISLDGLELQYASPRLQEDHDLVIKACLKHGRALEFCPTGHLRSKLLSDRDFMLRVVRQQGGAIMHSRDIPENLRNDREILFEALLNGMDFRKLPFSFQNDKNFVLEVMHQRPSLYLDACPFIQADIDVAKVATKAAMTTPQIQAKAFQLIPELLLDRDIIMLVAEKGDLEFFRRYTSTVEGAKWCQDKEVMLKVLPRHDGAYNNILHRDLKRDPDILEASMHSDTAFKILQNISFEQQTQYPQLVVKAITVVNRKMLHLLGDCLNVSHWTNRDITKAWIMRGCHLHNRSIPLVSNDRELLLLVARYVPMEFANIDTTYVESRDFMKEVVVINGTLLRYAPSVIRDDLDMIVLSFSETHYALQPPFSHTHQDVKAYIESKLCAHDTFVNTFLRGVAISTPRLAPYHRSNLNLLDRGMETSEGFKRRIAEFIGVPFGNEPGLLRRALRNLLPRQSSAREEEDDDEAHEGAIARHHTMSIRLRRQLAHAQNNHEAGDNMLRNHGQDQVNEMLNEALQRDLLDFVD